MILEEVYPDELPHLFGAMAKRKGEDFRQKILAAAQAAMVPHLKEADRKSFFRSLEKRSEKEHNAPATREELAELNRKAKDIFRN